MKHTKRTIIRFAIMLTMMLMTSSLVQAGSNDLRFSDLFVRQVIDASNNPVVISNDLTNNVYAIISDHIVQIGYTRVYDSYTLPKGHQYEVIENTGQNTHNRYFTFKPSRTTHNHIFSKDWSYDNDYHWHECVADGHNDVCREEEGSEKATHTYGTTGDSRFMCTVCGYVNTTKKEEVANTSVVEKTPSGQTNQVPATIQLNSNLFVRWKGNNVLVNWGTVPSADSYEVWATYCGTSSFELVTTVQSGSKATIKKIKGKKLNKKRGVKAYVVAKQGGTSLGRTLYGHSASPKHSRTNAKKVTVKKNSYSLSVGQTAKIDAKTVKSKSSKKLLHNGYLRYASSNNSVATVSSGGRITAVGAGTCEVWVYALNGKSKTVTVNVK